MADAPPVSVEAQNDAILNLTLPTKFPRRCLNLCLNGHRWGKKEHKKQAEDASHAQSSCVMARKARDASTLTMDRR